MTEQETTMFIRHADKGKWKIDFNELKTSLSEDEAILVKNTLKQNFPELNESPITLEGIKRTMQLANDIFEKLPKNGLLISMDSGKERAFFTRSLIDARIAQLETINEKNYKTKAKRIDMMLIEEKDLRQALKDTNAETWKPYGKMVAEGLKTEDEAIALWINDTNTSDSIIPDEISPKGSAERYRKLIRSLRERITSDKVPVTFLGIGHSGPLSQIRFEKQQNPASAEDAAKFCEIFEFDDKGNLIGTKQTQI